MKLSSGWEQSVYVLLILSYLPENKTLNSTALSDRLDVSQTYLKKIIKQLVNENLVYSSSGKFGGFSLARPLAQVNFYDVFIAIEGRSKIFSSQQLLKKFLGKEGEQAQRCTITSSLNFIENTLIQTLSNISLEQIALEIQEKYQLYDLKDWITQHIK